MGIWGGRARVADRGSWGIGRAGAASSWRWSLRGVPAVVALGVAGASLGAEPGPARGTGGVGEAPLSGPSQGPPTIGSSVGPSPVVTPVAPGSVDQRGGRAPTGESAIRRAASAMRSMGPVSYNIVGFTGSGEGSGGEVRFAGTVCLVSWSRGGVEQWRGAIRGQVASEGSVAGGGGGGAGAAAVGSGGGGPAAAWGVQRLDLFLEPPEAGLLRHGARQIIAAEDAGVSALLDQGPRLHVQWLADLCDLATAPWSQLGGAVYRGTAEVDGRECHVVSVPVVESPRAGGRVHRVTWYLGANDYFPRRVESRAVPPGMESAGAALDALPAQAVISVTRVRALAPEQAEEEMRWTLPGNYDSRTVGELLNDPGAVPLAGPGRTRPGAHGFGLGGAGQAPAGGATPDWALPATGPGRQTPALLTGGHLRGRVVVVGFVSGWAPRAGEIERAMARLRQEGAGRALTVLVGRCWEAVPAGDGAGGPVARAQELAQRDLPVWGAVTGGPGGAQPATLQRAESLAVLLGLDAVPAVAVLGPDGGLLLARQGWSEQIEVQVRELVLSTPPPKR